MKWSESAVGFTIFMIMGIIFLLIEKKNKPNIRIWYQFFRFGSFGALFWANLLLVLGDREEGTIIVYILSSFITTIMTIKEEDSNNEESKN